MYFILRSRHLIWFLHNYSIYTDDLRQYRYQCLLLPERMTLFYRLHCRRDVICSGLRLEQTPLHNQRSLLNNTVYNKGRMIIIRPQIVDKALPKRESFFYFYNMIEQHTTHQGTLEFVSIDELVPADHLLRKISKHIDFGFIRTRVEQYYCTDNGRPAIDPVILFKMLFIGYLFGIRM